MIYEIELALSNRSICNNCREKILKGEPRGKESFGFICYKCVPKFLKAQINKTKKMERDFKFLMEKLKKNMILNRL